MHPRMSNGSVLLPIMLLSFAACGPLTVNPSPDTMEPTGQVAPTSSTEPTRSASRPASGSRLVADSLADARALEGPNPSDALPELVLPEEPSWDIDVARFAEHPRVQYYLDYFSGPAHDRFQIWLERMPRYESLARQRLTERELPGDLVYLALIESGFSPIAVSRSKAVGMWQFMSPTGRAYGLRITPWLDERRDPVKSTDAAARYLSDLTRQFGGSNYLAAAAYNGGPGRVGRGLLRISALLGEGDEAIDPASDDAFFELAETSHIYQETKDYVPKLIAAALIGKAPERYGFTPVTDPVESFPLDSVIVEGGTGLDLVARLAGISLEELRELNPHLLRGITPPGERYAVRIPSGTSARVAERYAAVPATERPAVLTHVVKRGETVSGIARRFGVDSDLLMSANRVARARSLQVGTTLYIPVSGTSLPAELLREPEPTGRQPVTHIVSRGETVSGIASRYGVSQSSLRAANGIGSNGLIKAGQRLKVSSDAAQQQPTSYVVRRGDTVGEIAERLGVSQSALIRENGLGRSARIRVGQRLRVPA